MNEATTTSSSKKAIEARRIGVVESDARDKTRKVVVQFSSRHPKYGKYVRKRSVLHVHDENNEAKVGDSVNIAEVRPLSKLKRWRLVKVLNSAGV